MVVRSVAGIPISLRKATILLLLTLIGADDALPTLISACSMAHYLRRQALNADRATRAARNTASPVQAHESE